MNLRKGGEALDGAPTERYSRVALDPTAAAAAAAPTAPTADFAFAVAVTVTFASPQLRTRTGARHSCDTCRATRHSWRGASAAWCHWPLHTDRHRARKPVSALAGGSGFEGHPRLQDTPRTPERAAKTGVRSRVPVPLAGRHTPAAATATVDAYIATAAIVSFPSTSFVHPMPMATPFVHTLHSGFGDAVQPHTAVPPHDTASAAQDRT